MAILAQRLIDAVASELNDAEAGAKHVRWPLSDLFEYALEAMEMCASIKPELFTSDAQIDLTAGSVQELPTEYESLVGVLGTYTSAGIDRRVSMGGDEITKWLKPCAHAAADYAVRSLSVDAVRPRAFYVSPPAPSYPPVKVLLRVVTAPQPIAAVTDLIVFPGGSTAMYFNALKDWMLYRAFMVDTESATSFQRANHHYEAFYRFFGLRNKLEQQEMKAQKNGNT